MSKEPLPLWRNSSEWAALMVAVRSSSTAVGILYRRIYRKRGHSSWRTFYKRVRNHAVRDGIVKPVEPRRTKKQTEMQLELFD